MDMLFSNYLHTLTGNLFVRLVLWCVVLDTAWLPARRQISEVEFQRGH